MGPARDPRLGPGPALKGERRRRLRAALRRILRPPRILRPTRAGWCFFVVIFGVGFAALNTGNNLLYLVLSLMLAFLTLSGVLSESALRGLEVKRRVPRELFADAANPVTLEVRNRQRRVPSFAVVVEDRVVVREPADEWDEARSAPLGRGFALRIGPGETGLLRYKTGPLSRGEHRLWGYRISTRFPFGLFLKSMLVEDSQEVVVYPAIERVEARRSPGAQRRRGELAAPIRGEGANVTGVREFVEGDPVRRIHWKSSLRRGELVVRELEDERDAELEVLLRTAGSRPGEDFEERVSWAASEVVAHLEAGRAVSLRTDAQRLAPGSGERQRARLLAFLARVQPGRGPGREGEARPSGRSDPGEHAA